MLIILLVAAPAAAQPPAPDDDDRSVEISATAEFGFNAPLYHRIQYGQDGTYFDYVDEGGQGVLFPFQRYSAELGLGDRHSVVFLWQPLELDTRARLDRDVDVYDVTFAEETPVDLLYSFPFYRVSYLYDLLDADRTSLELGASLQIRNATISFETADGTLRREQRDVGLVPIIKTRVRHQFPSNWWIGAEADGFYAPIRYLNISDQDVTGAILDASIRAGYEISDDIDPFLNIRYLGGGSEGTSERQADEQPGDGFTRNWLNFLTVSLGVEVSF